MFDEALQPLRHSPASSGIFLDFDGTLSEIVHLPDAARPAEGATELLARLAESFRVVSIVSGRSALQLVEWLGPDVEIWGTHGAERAVGGKIELSDAVLPYADLMAQVKNDVQGRMDRLGMAGISLEDKTVMLGLHFRAAEDVPGAQAALREIAEEVASQHGLTIAGGRLAFELRPPIDLSKAAVVLQRAREERLTAALFAGDDRVDLPGFDALDVLASEGVATLRVAVNSDEAPPELLERGDVVVDGPRGAIALLKELLPR
jgi:trehalose 6-phosphate phosphatase